MEVIYVKDCFILQAGGKYGNGVIGKTYAMGQTIDVDIDIVANHWGYFVLNICPVDGKNSDPTQDCFDKHPLMLTNNPSSYKFNVPLDSPKITRFKYQVHVCVIVKVSMSFNEFQ